MQWQFRKALQSFEGYKRAVTYRNQIQNGDQNTLDVVAREIELILTDKNEKILPKVLAMRFIRDIMILGQEDVVRRIQKLVPTFTRICSHDLSSSDPDRGQTFFHDHPAYRKTSDEEQKKQIDTLGSTFLILTLQSVYHWAQWIPLDSNGKQSIYAKAYMSLVDRGVTFPSAFHYYKQSDTQKFKNCYKMEFFTDSYESAYSEPSEVQQSQVSQVEVRQSRSGWEKKSKVKEIKQLQSSEEYTGQARHLKNVSQIIEYMTQLKQSKSRKMGVLREINSKVQDMYQIQQSMNKLPKDQKRWLQNFIINFSLLNSNIIDYEQFLQRSLSQQIIIEQGIQKEDITINNDLKTKTPKPYQIGKQKDSKIKSEVGSNIIQASQINKKIEYQYKIKLNALMVEIEEKNNQINIVRSNFQKERNQLVQDCQNRINAIKVQVKKGNVDKGQFQRELEKDNQKLKAKIAVLQDELSSSNYNNHRQRDLQSQRNTLLTKVKKLQLQNQKLHQVKAASRNYDKEISTFQASLKQKQAALQTLRNQLKKSEKKSKNYQDESTLYKSQLINQRAKHEQKLNTLSKSKQSLQNENKSLKQKMLEHRKMLDIKQIQIINIKQELKRYQLKMKDIKDNKSFNDPIRSEQFGKSKSPAMYQSPSRGHLPSSPQVEPYAHNVHSNEKKLRFNNYEDLFYQLKPSNKELFIRLCRCGMKKKDILLKQNQMQIGIITQSFKIYPTFYQHFIKTCIKFEDLIQCSQSYVSTLDYQIQNKYIFCIQPQEQEKVIVFVKNKEVPFLKERAILEVSFQKNGNMYNSNIFLPFLIPKFYDFYRPKAIKIPDRSKNPKEVIQFRYNKKMLPKSNSLKSFFDQIEEVLPNKYELDAFHRQTDLTVKLTFTLTHDTQSLQLEGLVLRQKINQKQRYVFEELISFMEIAFKK